jgi:hypothetical protein
MTARIPGAKRGRPAKPKRSKALSGSKGRPPVPLHLHPRRYEIALFDAWSYLMGSERLAATFVARNDLQLYGLPTPEDFNKAADSLRNLAKSRISRDDLEWRTAMGEAVAISFVPGDSRLKARLVLRRAATVNETEFALAAMLPVMLDTDSEGVARFVAELSQDDEPVPVPELI